MSEMLLRALRATWARRKRMPWCEVMRFRVPDGRLPRAAEMAVEVDLARTLARLTNPSASEGRAKDALLAATRLARVAGHQTDRSVRICWRSLRSITSRYRTEHQLRPGIGGEVVHNCHRLKTLNAACTKRVARYMAAHPRTRSWACQGPCARFDLRLPAHILFWALKGKRSASDAAHGSSPIGHPGTGQKDQEGANQAENYAADGARRVTRVVLSGGTEQRKRWSRRVAASAGV
jgi:hypothetical protein